MIDKIKIFLMTENGIEILKLVVTIGIAYITAKITAKNTKKNLTTQYFKEKGTEIQEKVLRFWCGLFMNDFKIADSYNEAFKDKKINNDTDILINIQKESYVYCSSKTIKAIREYQQYLYKSKSINNEELEELEDLQKKKSKKNIKLRIKATIKFANQFILITRIISRMKYDFTGEKVDELDLIKIKIKNLDLPTRFLCRIILWYYNIKELFVKLLLISIILLIIFLVCSKYF